MSFNALIVPTLILIWGLVEDLRQKKVPNRVVLICAAVGLISHIYLSGWSGLTDGLLGAGTALAMMLPLVLVGVVGAGDMKLSIAFGLSYQWQGVLVMTIAALAWGAILGTTRALVSGQFLSLAKNTAALMSRSAKTEKIEMHSIPYTAALLFGWITHVSYIFYGLNPLSGVN
jgi:Flp pilus assembly protein protease CpaA